MAHIDYIKRLIFFIDGSVMQKSQKLSASTYAQAQQAKLNPLGYENLSQMFTRVCQERGGDIAYSCLGKELSFADIDRLSGNLAAYLLHECGLKKGDRIAIQLPNILQYPVVAWGALRAGLVVVNTNPLYTEREILHQFNDAGVKAVVVLSDLLPLTQKILKQTAIEHVIVTSALDLVAPNTALIEKTEGVTTLTDALKQGGKRPSVNAELSMDDIALLQYTGGTTGVAKGAVLTQGNIFSGYRMRRETFKELDVENEVVIAPMPLYHIYGFATNVISVFLHGGLSVLIPNPRDPGSLVEAMQQYEATAIVGVNTLFQAMMDHPDFDKIRVDRLVNVVGGGTAMVQEVAQQWQLRTGVAMHEGYGLSETAAAFASNMQGRSKVGTVGKAFFNMQVRTITDDGLVTPQGQAGELCVRGPQVMQSYWNNPKATEEVLDKDGWFKTGDVAVIQEDGFIKIVDRLKDLVLVSGFNVYPTEIENVVYEHADVLECAVIGVPDDKTGEAVKLFVNSGNPDLTPDDLKAFCRESLTGYKMPKYIEFMGELPKSNVGKILRRSLR